MLSINAAWDGAETVFAIAEGNQKGATLAFEDKMLSLTRKPDINTNSPIESRDLTLRGQFAAGSPGYDALLPLGRATLTGGSYVQQLDGIRVNLRKDSSNWPGFSGRSSCGISQPCAARMRPMTTSIFILAKETTPP